MRLLKGHLSLETDILPGFLTDGGEWHSLDITYEHPRVERVMRRIDDVRLVFLNVIHPIPDGEQPFYHSHPWPSSVRVHGSYVMRSGSGIPHGAPPPVTLEQVVQSGSFYEMAHPEGWHSVWPIGHEPVLSVMRALMISGNGWYRPPTQHLGLTELSPQRVNEILQLFRCLYPNKTSH